MAVSYQKSWLAKAVIRAADLIKASLKAEQLIFCEASACRQKGLCIAHTSDSTQQGMSWPCIARSIIGCGCMVLLRAWRPPGNQDREKS